METQAQTDRRALHMRRLEMAQRVISGQMPTQHEWYQLGEGAREAWGEADRETLMRAYRMASKRLGIVGAGQA